MSKIAAIVLAAGQSRRWGRDNKLLAPIDGLPMIVRTISALLASPLDPVIVMLGHEAVAIRSALAGLPVRFEFAKDFAKGMSATLKAGIAALPDKCDGALICMGDMPWIRSSTVDRLVKAFDEAKSVLAVIPAFEGARGNPVLVARALFPQIIRLSGDTGARSFLHAIPEGIVELAIDDPGVLRDADKPESLRISI